LREGMRLNVRWEAFNVFNTPNLGQPNDSFSCSSTSLFGGPCTSFSTNSHFGKITSTQGSSSQGAAAGRKMQIALTLFY